LFYQFGPYAAYFNVGRFQDVIDLATATLNARPELEESYVWRGWAWYMLGKRTLAITDFRAALAINPNFADAQNALGILGVK
jgi:tetratricopeptide (TPR) repeat protein